MGNNRIRIVTLAGDVSTLAGSGNPSFADGAGTNAAFNGPIGVILGNSLLYVADFSNHRIRAITAAGEVSTIAGSGAASFADGAGTIARFNYPQGVTVTSNGIIIVADRENHRIRSITPTGIVTTLAGSTRAFADGVGTNAAFKTLGRSCFK